MRTLPWILLCLAACDAGEKPAPPAPAKPAPAKPIADSVADLTYLPSDSDLVMHIDVAALRASKLWATYARDVAKLLPFTCELDPQRGMATVDIGIPLATELGVFVFRGLDRDDTLACLRVKTEKRTVTFDGDFVTLTTKGGASYVLTFVDAHTMVMQGTKQPTKQTLQQALKLGADAPLRTNGSFAMALNKAKRSAALTIVSRPDSEEVAKTMKALGVKLSHLYGALAATDRLEVHYAMVVGSQDEATRLATMLQGQLGSKQTKDMFDRIEARAQGDTVTVEVAMSEQKLASLVGMMRPMLSGP